MTRPLIGVSCYVEQARWGVWDLPAALLPTAYTDAVTRAGGVPVLLPPVEGVEAAAGRLDGLLLAGGPDVDPARYGADPQPQTQPPRPARDAAELALLGAAAAAGVPVLAVCRGLQILNVARGGTLLQHLPDVVGHLGHNPVPGVFGRCEVRVEPGSRLSSALAGGDGPMTVACHHHQAVDRLGAGLSVVARAADGTVEAIEDGDRPFLLGVQWHPEVAEDAGLFRALVVEATAVPEEDPTRLSPTPEEADRRLQRLADRLRVMGPRLAGRNTPGAGAALTAVRGGLQQLADLAADADGRPRRDVPQLGAHALGDQALVLGHDLLRERDDRFRVAAVQALDAVYGLL